MCAPSLCDDSMRRRILSCEGTANRLDGEADESRERIGSASSAGPLRCAGIARRKPVRSVALHRVELEAECRLLCGARAAV
jgi:hypothetical protein